jgi:DhnA family fructose-bisphosphate aldolase class Ia
MTHSGAAASASLGRLSRLERLGGRKGLNLLALDHAVTEGYYLGQDDPRVVVSDCVSHGIKGIVCHKGLLRALPLELRFPVFLQLFGASSLGIAKAQLLEPEVALTLDCVGVAVELNVDSDSSALSTAFQIVERAQHLGLLTLLMLSFKGEGAEPLTRAIVVASQVGSDFIKVGLPTLGLLTPSQRQALEQTVRDAPPLLLAGGTRDGSLDSKLNLARELGFSGTCIGRSYFWRPERQKNLDAVTRAFTSN